MNTILCTYYKSPCGDIIVGSIDDELCLCDWVNRKNRETIDRRMRRILKADMQQGTSSVIELAIQQFDEYFSGERKSFDIPLRFAGTDFQQLVWKELCRIPYGQTASYGEVAVRIGMPTSVRAVANANGANAIAIFVPCHRVIGSNKTLTGYAGGLEAKQFLLDQERYFTHTFT